MTKIILSGANGKMGRVIQNVVSLRDDCEIVAGVDLNTESTSFPVYADINEITEKADVIIDFSNPVLLDNLLAYSKANKMPLVIATTGYDDNQKAQINDASKECPIFFTYNMSMGINLLANLAKTAAKVLGGQYDIEIIEKHHNQKIDAPSGTAIMLADAINEELDNKYHYVYDRHSVRAKREKTEIGMHSVRGGTIVGEHEIIFAGRDEVISLKHEAHSKQVFAVGAVNAGVFLCGKPAGLYAMSDLLASL